MHRHHTAWAAAAFIASSALVGFLPYRAAGGLHLEQRLSAHSNLVTSASGAPSPAAPNVVTVHATDYKFKSPDRIPSGMTTFVLVNEGRTFHHVQIVRLTGGKTLADLSTALKHPGPVPSWAVFVGGPDAPSPGDTANATLALSPGNYALLCFVDVPGGVPHFAYGMVHPLTVFDSGKPAASAPVADVRVTVNDYNFVLSKPLTAGEHTFMVRNTAAQPHEMEVIRLAPGKTAQDALKWIQKPEGPPPGSGVGGVSGITSAEPVYFSANLPAGNYLLICFIPDAKDGKPHFMHGMMKTVKVS